MNYNLTRNYVGEFVPSISTPANNLPAVTVDTLVAFGPDQIVLHGTSVVLQSGIVRVEVEPFPHPDSDGYIYSE